jgi:hypothetical protein
VRTVGVLVDLMRLSPDSHQIAATIAPVEDEEIEFHARFVSLAVQVTPASELTYICPPFTTAKTSEPVEDVEIEFQL